MTLKPEYTANTSSSLETVDQGPAAPATGSLVINLCTVETPITIPQPRSAQLAHFSFFLTHRWEAGRRTYQLHMGYFSTEAEAEKWLKVLRGIYPNAFVGEAAAAQTETLTDTRVLKILEQRGADAAAGGVGSTAGGVISLLGPDETAARLALRDAVTRDEPVSFAVQLQWSAQPLDLQSVPRHPIFAPYTLYQTRARHEGQQWFGLRLGFFNDVISAKQVAQYVRADFASVAVVPVSAQEQSTAMATGKTSTGLAATASSLPRPATVSGLRAAGTAAPQNSRGDQHAVKAAPARRSPGTTLEQTLEMLRTSELDISTEDDMSSTGVRHLRIEVERKSPPARKPGKPSLRTRKP